MIRKFALWSLLLVLFTACDYQDLYMPVEDMARVRVKVNWEKYNGEMPEGMTLYVFDANGNLHYQTSTNNIEYVDLNLPAGVFSFRVMNQSPVEFANIRFREMEHLDLSEGYTVPVEIRTPVEPNAVKKEILVNSPEDLGIGNKTDVTVTEEMVQITKDHILRDGKQAVAPIILTTLEPVNVVKHVKIYVKVKGIKYARHADGLMNNMASGCYLKDGNPSPGVVTHILNNWEIEPDPKDPEKGRLVYLFSTFGLPTDHTGLPEENQLTMNILLVDNKTKISASLDVGHLFRKVGEELPVKGIDNEEEGVDWIVEVELPDALPEVEPDGGGDDGHGGGDDGNEGGSAGFDVDVDEWGDEVEEDIVV